MAPRTNRPISDENQKRLRYGVQSDQSHFFVRSAAVYAPKNGSTTRTTKMMITQFKPLSRLGTVRSLSMKLLWEMEPQGFEPYLPSGAFRFRHPAFPDRPRTHYLYSARPTKTPAAKPTSNASPSNVIIS